MANREVREFFVTTAKGMEDLLLQELSGLGIGSVTKGRGGVSFRGTIREAYRVCLGSRIANRVLLPLKTFFAPHEDRLYSGIRQIRWASHFTENNTIAVDFASSQSKITHTQYGALKVKDAIVDQFRDETGTRPSVSVVQPDIQVNVYIFKDEATVSLDLSGESLHRRGYRQEGANAPLKENLAAALLMSAGWPLGPDTAFLDPMCGSGTLGLEAALMAGNIAPGLGRDYFGFLKWKGHQEKIWKDLIEEAKAAIIYDPKKLPKIVGYDQDFRAVRAALKNTETHGIPGLLRGRVHFEKKELTLGESIAPKGIFMVNPPYGERLGDEESLRPLYKEIGDLMKQKFKGWEGYIFTGSPVLAKSVGLKASKKMVFFNGPIECRLLKFELY
jgi:23S rRNA (guanine2445-N2)-methyltransferase / 23S rRNA (guanine2069-N7)-methyltransferase